MVYFIVPIAIGLIVSLILSIVFKKSAKIDKGIELNYFKLSYRRKMIRTLVNIPVMILLLIFIYGFSDWGTLANTLIGLFFASILFIQIAYNYFMWQKNEVV